MTHDEIKAALPALALDALDPAERAEVQVHVRGCDECQAELLAFERVTDGIGLEASPVTPPPALKSQVFQGIGVSMPVGDREGRNVIRQFPPPARPSSAWQRLMPFALAASLLVAVGTLYYAGTLRRDLNELTTVVRVMQAPDLVRADLKGQATATGAVGRAMWSRTGFVFTADRLPKLPEGRVYQLWTITGSTPTSAGLLTLGANGSATLRVAVPAGAATPSAFGVTIEPAGGSATPTMPIVLLGAAGQ